MAIQSGKLTAVNDFSPGRRYAFDLKQEQDWHPDIVEPEFWDILQQMWDYTVCGTAALYHVYNSVKYLTSNLVTGDFVECGVFLGGSIMFAAELCSRYDRDQYRRIFAFDTFSGFTSQIPGLDVDYAGNDVCMPSPVKSSFLDISANNMRSTSFDNSRLHIIEGDVLETLKSNAPERIAYLRLDTDTYETTLFELNALYDRVVLGGIVIIDDYGFNAGCAKAVDSFAAGRLIFPMRQDRWGRSWVKVR